MAFYNDFNTSHVTVYLVLGAIVAAGVYFNTSHVTVYLSALFLIIVLVMHFNTSHVTVYRTDGF